MVMKSNERDDDYAKYRTLKIEQGQRYEDFIKKELRQIGMFIEIYSSRDYQFSDGESPNGAEVKYDGFFAKTHRLWIEFAEKAAPRAGLHAASGIMRDDGAVFHIQGDYETVFIFSRSLLRLIWRNGKFKAVENNTGTSLGFYLGSRLATGVAMRVLSPKANEKILRVNAKIQDEAAKFLWSLRVDPAQRRLFDGGLGDCK